MTITYFVLGTKPEARVIGSLSAAILDLAGEDPSKWELGEISPESAVVAAESLESLPDSKILPFGQPGPGSFHLISSKGMYQYLGSFQSRKDLRSYLQFKAERLRAVASEAIRRDTLVTYG